MDIEVFIHGVPNGESFLGKDEDRKFFETFYSENCLDEVKYLIQTRSINGKTYCYYSYLRYKDVIGYDNRPGSYFGFTIRLDEYCVDVHSMYCISNLVYHRYILGNILKKTESKLKYTVSAFKDLSPLLSEIKTYTVQLFLSMFSKQKGLFVALNGFATNGINSRRCNLYDCTNDNVSAFMKQYGKVAISPFYETNEIIAERQQYKKSLKEKEEEISRLKRTLLTAPSGDPGYEKLLKKLKEKDEEISRLNLLLQSSSQSDPKKVSNKPQPIIDMIIKNISVINTVLIFIVICILLTPHNSSNSNESSSMPEPTPVAMEERVADSVKNDDAYNNIPTEEPVVSKDNVKKEEPTPTPPETKQEKPRINIKNYNGKDSLGIGKKYTIEILNYTGKGHWKCMGCNCENPNKFQTTITPTDKNVTIEFYDEKNKLIKSRKIPAK